LPKSLKDFFLKFVSVVDKGDNPEAKILLFKSAEDEIKEKGGAYMKTFEELMKELPDEDRTVVEGEIEKAKAEMTEEQKKKMEEEKAAWMKKEEENLKKDEPLETNAEELIKSADPKIQELVKKLQEDVDKSKGELEKVELEKKAKEDELKKELLSKEAEKYPNIGATKEDLVKILGSVDEDTSILIKAVLSADNEALKDNAIIKSVGSSGDGVDKTAKQEIEEKAQELAKAEKITIEKARTKIYKSEPELMKKLREEE
jgi:hypothetical protein